MRREQIVTLRVGRSEQIGLHGRGRWMDNVFVERLWRSTKYECACLRAFETGSELRVGVARWIGYYNAHRPHSRLAGQTLDETCSTPGLQSGRGTSPAPQNTSTGGMITTSD